MRLHLVLPSSSVATLGAFHRVQLADLRRYVRRYPLAWATA